MAGPARQHLGRRVMIVMVEVTVAVLTIMLVLNIQESGQKMARAQAAIIPNLPDKKQDQC